MLNKENTEQTLEAWGADIVKFARININDRKRLRLTNSQGFIKMTPARTQGFAEFVAWKVSTIGSDVTDFMTDAVEMAGKKHRKDLEESMFKDIDQEVGMVLRSLENGSSNI